MRKKTKTNNIYLLLIIIIEIKICVCVDFIRSTIDWQTLGQTRDWILEFVSKRHILPAAAAAAVVFTGVGYVAVLFFAKFTYLINLLLLFFSLSLLLRLLIYFSLDVFVFFLLLSHTYMSICFSINIIIAIGCYRVFIWIIWEELWCINFLSFKCCCCCCIEIEANKSNIFITIDNNSIGCEIMSIQREAIK